MTGLFNDHSASQSFISGVPAVATAYAAMAETYTEDLISVITSQVASLEKTVRSRARAAWGDVADGIQIYFDPKTFDIVFDVDPAYAEEANAAEYGSASQSPSAVLRMAAVEARQILPLKIKAQMKGVGK